MKDITEKQIGKINTYMSKMTESQQDKYVQKLEEAGIIQNILAKFGSPANNLKKLQKQKSDVIKQIDGMIKAVSSAKAPNVTPDQRQKDVQALVTLKQKVMNIDVNIQLNETPDNQKDETSNNQNENASSESNQ